MNALVTLLTAAFWPGVGLALVLLAYRTGHRALTGLEVKAEHVKRLTAVEAELAEFRERLKTESSFAALSATMRQGRR